jgi:cytochrome P450
MQIILGVASIHTSASTVTQTLYDLAAMPNSTSELNQEILGAVSDPNALFSNADLSKLGKLDSFIKETQRFHSPDLSKL